MKIIVAVVIGSVIFYLMIRLAKEWERKRFNNGICKCGGHFQPFDFRVFIGSDGSRGYSCDRCNESVFCSYDVDKGYEYKPSRKMK
jgi:hypothetical protein